MSENVPLHRIEPIVTPDRFEYGAHRMRVPGGWLYWLQPAGGAPVSSFVPDPPEPPSLLIAGSLSDRRRAEFRDAWADMQVFPHAPLWPEPSDSREGPANTTEVPPTSAAEQQPEQQPDPAAPLQPIAQEQASPGDAAAETKPDA